MERLVGDKKSQSWASVMPRFMNPNNPTAQHEHLMTQLLSIERDEKRFYAKMAPGTIVLLGLDTFSVHLAKGLGTHKLCTELILMSPQLDQAQRTAHWLQQACLLSGSSTLMSASCDFDVLSSARFVILNADSLTLGPELQVLRAALNDNKAPCWVILHGETSTLLECLPQLAMDSDVMQVVGIERHNLQDFGATLKVLSFVESILYTRPQSTPFLMQPNSSKASEALLSTTIHQLAE